MNVTTLWLMALTSPLIYLVICIVIDRTVFAGRAAKGFFPLSESLYAGLFGFLAVLAVAGVFSVYALLKNWAARVAEDPADSGEGTLSRRTRRYFVIFAICDTIALCGLILFLIQGDIRAMVFFGIAAMVGYAAAYPAPRAGA